MMRKGKRKSAADYLAAAVILTCFLAQTIDCYRLKKTERREGRTETDTAGTPVVQEGKILFGRVFEKGSGLDPELIDGTRTSPNASAEHEAAFQADSAGWSPGQTQEAHSPEASWKRMSPSLQCGGEQLRFRAVGQGASNFALDHGGPQAMPLSQVPSTCGYTMQKNPLALLMLVPYDGCNVFQEGGNYVLPMRWQGIPVSLLCPKSAAAPTTAAPRQPQQPQQPQQHQILQFPQMPQIMQMPRASKGPEASNPEQPRFIYLPNQFVQYPKYPSGPAPTKATTTTTTTTTTAAPKKPVVPQYIFYPGGYPHHFFGLLPQAPAAATTAKPTTTTTTTTTTPAPPAHPIMLPFPLPLHSHLFHPYPPSHFFHPMVRYPVQKPATTTSTTTTTTKATEPPSTQSPGGIPPHVPPPFHGHPYPIMPFPHRHPFPYPAPYPLSYNLPFPSSG